MNNFMLNLNFKRKTKMSSILSKFTKISFNENVFRLINSKALSFEDLLFLNVEVDTNFKLTGYLGSNKVTMDVRIFYPDNTLWIMLFINDFYVDSNNYKLCENNIPELILDSIRLLNSYEVLPLELVKLINSKCRILLNRNLNESLTRPLLKCMNDYYGKPIKWKLIPGDGGLSKDEDNYLVKTLTDFPFLSKSIERLDHFIFNLMLDYFEWKKNNLS